MTNLQTGVSLLVLRSSSSCMRLLLFYLDCELYIRVVVEKNQQVQRKFKKLKKIKKKTKKKSKKIKNLKKEVYVICGVCLCGIQFN